MQVVPIKSKPQGTREDLQTTLLGCPILHHNLEISLHTCYNRTPGTTVIREASREMGVKGSDSCGRLFAVTAKTRHMMRASRH